MKDKEQFIAEYIKRSGMSREEFDELRVALPCDCDDGGGPTHWAVVPNDPQTIKDHMILYLGKT